MDNEDCKVVSMAKVSGSGMRQSPQGALEDALADLGKRGAFKDGNKILIIALDDNDGQFRISWIQAGMRMTDCISLCEVAKTSFLDAMGY